jgi:hypothetical protein
MRCKADSLSGRLLDAAVAKALGYELDDDGWRPSTEWSVGGPIIEAEKIDLTVVVGGWCAGFDLECFGRTPLEAAMRFYVASKLGEEVEL